MLHVLIEMAIGVLITRYSWTRKGALQQMEKAAQYRNVSLRDIAKTVSNYPEPKEFLMMQKKGSVKPSAPALKPTKKKVKK